MVSEVWESCREIRQVADNAKGLLNMASNGKIY